jgi:hypothetical protein
MVALQIVLLALAWYLFEHDHTASGRIFVGAILLTGALNVARGLSLVSAARSRQSPRGRRRP